MKTTGERKQPGGVRSWLGQLLVTLVATWLAANGMTGPRGRERHWDGWG